MLSLFYKKIEDYFFKNFFNIIIVVVVVVINILILLTYNNNIIIYARAIIRIKWEIQETALSINCIAFRDVEESM